MAGPAVRRRRTLAAFGAGVASLLMLPALGWFAADAIRESKEGADALAGLTPLVPIPATPTALVAGLDEQGHVVSVAVMALAPESDGVSAGGTVVILPAGSDTYLPDGSRGRVGDSFAQGGLEALVSTAEGLLGVSFSAAVAVPEAGLARLIGDLGAIDVSLQAPVVDDTRSGSPSELFEQGPTTLDPDGIAAVLTAASSEQSELDRLPNVDAVWRGVAARVGAGLSLDGTEPSTAVTDERTATTIAGVAPIDIDTYVARLFSGPLQVHWLAADAVTDPASNPDGLDLLRLDTGEVTVVMATVAPSAVSPANPTLTFYVKSSLNDPALTKDAVERLLLAGANVVLVTENPDQTPPGVTRIEYADANDADETGRFGEQLGTFTSQLSDVRIDGVDATFILGESYRSERSAVVHGGEAAGSNSSTPVTAVATTESTTG